MLFGCDLRYVSHSPASSGDTLRVRLVAAARLRRAGRRLGRAARARRPRRHSLDDVDRTLGTRRGPRASAGRSRSSSCWCRRSNGRGLRIRLVRAGGRSLEGDRARGDRRRLHLRGQPRRGEGAVRRRRHRGRRAGDGRAHLRLRDRDRRAERGTGCAPARSSPRRTHGACSRPPARTTRRRGSPSGTTAALNAVGLPDAVASVAGDATRRNATLTPHDLDQTLKQAREAFRRKDYATAIPLLTRLMEQPEFPQRAEALELLGLARERSGQLAHAKAEYEEYLRRYPAGRGRGPHPQAAAGADLRGQPGERAARAAAADESPWKLYGGVSQVYRRDTSSFDNGTASSERDDPGRAAERRRAHGAPPRRTLRFRSRVQRRATPSTCCQDGPGDQARVSLMFAELHDHELDWTVRGGRQSGSVGGLLGTFDGLYAGYQVRRRVRLNAHVGYPVESTRDAPDDRPAASTRCRPTSARSPARGTFRCTRVSQDYFGLTDRQAVGSEVRYFRPGLTFVGLVDYDIHYQRAERRAAARHDRTAGPLDDERQPRPPQEPAPEPRNALIGQPVTTLRRAVRPLLAARRSSSWRAIARRTSDVYTLSLSRPFGERWQWSMDVSSMSLGATPASGGVAATPDVRDGPRRLDAGARLRPVRSRRRVVARPAVPVRRHDRHEVAGL